MGNSDSCLFLKRLAITAVLFTQLGNQKITESLELYEGGKNIKHGLICMQLSLMYT